MTRRRQNGHGGARLWLLTSLLAASLAGLHPAPAASAAPTPPEPVVLRADAAGVVLEWRAPAFSLRRVIGDDGHPYSVLEAPGWVHTGEPGQPQLPLASALAVVPPSGDVTLQVQVLERTRRPLSHPVVPARAPVPVGNPPTHTEWAWTRDEQTYATAGPRPADVVTLEEAGWLRGRRLVRLTYYPLRFDPAGNALEVAGLVRVELQFPAQSSDGAQGEAGNEAEWDRNDPFIPVLQNSVVNPAQVTHLACPERPASAPPSAASPSATTDSNPRYKLIISREGVYELTHDALVAAGIPVHTTPRTAYRLEYAGEEVAYQWEGDGDGDFEPGERILFYARPTPTRFANHDVYWLTVGASGTPMAGRTGTPAGLPPATAWATAIAEHNEGSQNYLSQYPASRDGDHWYWDQLYWDYTTQTGEREEDFGITLATPDSGASNATLHVYLQGTTYDISIDPDHRVQVRLNGSLLGTAEWDSVVYHTATFSPQAGLLQAGSNTVHLHLPGTGAPSGVEEAWLDALELRYGVSDVAGDPIRVEGEAGHNAYTLSGLTSNDVRIYDVTSPTAAQVVTGFTASAGSVTFGDADAGTATYFLLTEDQIAAPDEIVPALTLADPPTGADYLLIAHSDLITAVVPLAAHRALSDGLRVFSATVEAVYDVYGDGRVDPEAIRNYIAHAYHNWTTPTLQYVLLVGDGTYDPLNNSQSPDHRPTYIPPYLAMADPWWGEAASDNRFVTVDGSDNIADVFIGRLPVNTVAEATTVADKILSYELNPPQWPWNERVLFFAGNESDAPYHQYSDDVYHDHLPSGFTGRRVYFCTSNCNEPHLYADITAAHDATMRELNAGGLLASYVGHSSWHQWAVDPVTYAPMFHLDDAASLHNGGALPVVLEMTCYTSQFSHPTDDTLDESLLRVAGGGAVATWGPATHGSSMGNEILHPEFFDAVFQDGIIGLGPATEAAKAHLPGYLSDLRDTTILFGDPAMELNLTIVPWAHEVFLPVTLRGN